MFECDPLEANRLASRIPSQRAVPPFVLRPSTGDDLGRVAALLEDAYTTKLVDDYHPNVLNAALPVITKPKESLIRSGTYLVADSGGGHLLAAGGWSWHGPVGGVAPRDTAHMRHVVVGSAYGGQGVGRVLLEAVMASAREAGVRRLLCVSTISAEGFYEDMGFMRLADVELTLGPGMSFPAVQMARAL
ncbi:GNAT family N-acetyltransferase [Celeribacter sp.]|uniref:GNAT family N-acetyltransferase n=1 Tax=Celeribacter sp. TaxID=1890673 RepID=UPI003A95BC57